MKNYQEALSHGNIQEILDNIFFVTGTMKNEFFGSMWQFSRNMTIVREEGNLTIFNSVRLNEDGLKTLDSLGKVTNIVRLGDMHGVDDPFYVDRYNADFWALPEMNIEDGLKIDKPLLEGGEMPVKNSSLFIFKTVKRPECLIRLDRNDGVLIACDSLQNWTKPDEFFDGDTVKTMTDMGFFTPANLGPAWMHGSEPKAEDFQRLKHINFKYVFCGHGTPVTNDAQNAFHDRFKKVFSI